MKPDTDKSKNPSQMPAAKADPKDDLKSLPMPEVMKRLNSSPDGLTDAEAKKRLGQYGPNQIEEKKTNPFLKVPHLFLGTHPVDD